MMMVVQQQLLLRQIKVFALVVLVLVSVSSSWYYVVVDVVDGFSLFTTTTTTSTSTSSSSTFLIRKQQQQQQQKQQYPFVVSSIHRGGGGGDSSKSNSSRRSSSSTQCQLSINQNELQDYIVDVTSDEVDALMKYTNKCSKWKQKDEIPPSYDEKLSLLRQRLKNIYNEYGIVLIRGLLDKTLLSNLIQAGELLIKKESMEFNADSFNSIKFGPIFGGIQTTSIEENDDNNDNNKEEVSLLSTFRNVALYSLVPSCIAMLLNLDTNLFEKSSSEKSSNSSSSSELRLLNDVFLSKSSTDKSFCGWHIDDVVFWPTQTTSSDKTPPGINAWIAMDDIPAQYGGSMAVIPKSHKSDWSSEAQHSIQHTITHPKEGLTTLGELFSTVSKTCGISDISPCLNEQMEQEGILFDYQKGDVLLMNRYIWHRSVMLSIEGKDYFLSSKQHSSENENDNVVSLKRYTIRYEIGSTPLINGISLHPSILFNSSNSGKSLSDVVGGPFFPKCWPCVEKSEMNGLHELVTTTLPKAQENKQKLMKEFQKSISPPPPSSNEK